MRSGSTSHSSEDPRHLRSRLVPSSGLVSSSWSRPCRCVSLVACCAVPSGLVWSHVLSRLRPHFARSAGSGRTAHRHLLRGDPRRIARPFKPAAPTLAAYPTPSAPCATSRFACASVNGRITCHFFRASAVGGGGDGKSASRAEKRRRSTRAKARRSRWRQHRADTGRATEPSSRLHAVRS